MMRNNKDSGLIALFVCLVAIVSFTLSECCEEVVTKCHEVNPPIRHMPGNEEELGAFCDNALKFLECAQTTEAECEDDHNFREMVEQVTPVMTNICAKDTGFYEDLADNLPCIKLNLPQVEFQCAVMAEDEDQALKFLQAVKDENIMELSNEEEEDEDDCLDELFYKSCTLGSLRNRCGAPARDVSLEIVEMIEALPSFPSTCKKEVNAKIRDLLRVMESEILDKKRRK